MSDETVKYTFVGRVVFIGETENVSKKADKPFYKRIIAVDNEDEGAKYPNPVPFEQTGDKCEYLDQYKVGDVVRVEFYPNGRGWKDPKTGKVRFFASNRIGFIDLAANADTPENAEATVAEADGTGDGGGDPDDMPF